jgi:endonuclease/exonuclease/phosphatase family metal-dependent hydrolase
LITAQRAGARAFDHGPIDRAKPHTNLTLKYASFDALPSPAAKLGDGRTVLVHNPEAEPPKDRESLALMSYNILLGGKRRESILAYFDGLEREGRLPDVMAFQEANQEISTELAKRYGYHLAYFGHGEPGSPERTLINGKAILSRHPISDAVHFTFGISDEDREATLVRQKAKNGPFLDAEDRGVLRATIELGARRIDVHDTHLSYNDPLVNADQFRQLRELIGSRPKDREAVLVGDFNANVGIKVAAEIEIYSKRYNPELLGNIASPEVLRETQALERVIPDVWRPGVERGARAPNGALITAEKAERALSTNAIRSGASSWKLFSDAAAGSTYEGRRGANGALEPSGERLDAIYATEGLSPDRVEVDWSTAASDHMPLIARLRPAPAAAPKGRRQLV